VIATYWLEHAWLGEGAVARGVLLTVEDERFAGVTTGVSRCPEGARRLLGLTLPGMANCHSHAFHRALRGRTQRGRGTFWTWREQMYALADRLEPDTYYELARATYREMLAAGFTSVGEFHYLHHGQGGSAYGNPNAMGLALVEAARDAGIRIALLDTCYLEAGVGRPVEGVQERFSDKSADAWANRLERLEHAGGDDVVIGAAVHSVRAVPPDQMRLVAAWAGRHQAPLHVHVSEQVAENEECRAAYGRTPTQLLAEAGVLGPRATAVHATHLTQEDIETLGRTRTRACFCPTTERDLGDGVGPSRQLHASGAPLTLGSDSHAMIDPFEEMRAVELDERLVTRARGHWSGAELLAAATGTGHASLGFTDVGRIEVGSRADLVTVDARSPRTAGTGPTVETAVFAAGAADVVQVIRDGQVVFDAQERRELGRELDTVIDRLWKDVDR
jgi:formiminoglutamate deiminase